MRSKDKIKLFETLKNTFLVDINIKLLCFLLAVVFYIFVAYSQLSEKTFVTKIEIKGSDSSLVISNSLPETVKVVLSDKKSVLDKISESDINVVLDLTEPYQNGQGIYTSKLQWNTPKVMKSFFSSITVTPEILSVEIESIKEKSVPVITPSVGELKSGYILKQKKSNPSEVRIRGPISVIDSIDNIETEKIDINGETESFERFLKLNIKNPKVKIIGSDEVSVYYMILKKTESKTVKINKVFVENLNPQFSAVIENLPLTLTLSGSEAVISSLTESGIVISVDCSNVFIPGEYTYKSFNINTPSDVAVTTLSPKNIVVRIVGKD